MTAFAVREVLREHPRHVVLVGLLLGLVIGPWTPIAVLLAVAAGAAAGMFWLAGDIGPDRHAAARPGAAGRPGPVRGSRPRALAFAVAVAVVLAGVGGQARVRALERTALRPLHGHVVRGDVTIVQAPRPQSSGGWSARASFRGEPVLLRVNAPRAFGDEGSADSADAAEAARRARSALAGAPGVGAIVAVRGAVRPPDEHARAIRAHAVIRVLDLRLTGRSRGGPAGFVDGVRRAAEDALAHGRDPTRVALLHGMVLGQDAGLPVTVRDEVRAAGLSHLTAASGANIVLLATLVIALSGLIGVPFHLRWVVVLGLIALYVPLAGGGPSIQRAGVMGAAGVVAVLAGRPSARWYALGLAGLATLTADPRAVADPGWQMSFAAVVALVTLARVWADRLARRRLPMPVAEALAVTGAATLATAPIIALHFGQVAPLSLPANLLVAPVVAPIMWLGFVAASLGVLVTPVAVVLDGIVDPLLGCVLAVAHRIAGAPGAAVAVPGGAVTVLVACAGTVLAVGAGGPPRVRLPGGRRLPVAVPVGAIAAAATLLAVVLAPGPPAPPPPVAGLRVSFLDVGQGDATLLEVPGHAVLVDTGPPDGDVVGALRRAGVRRLDALVVTHAQADHDGGAADVLDALPVGLVVDGRDGVRSPLGDRFAAVARRKRVRLAAVRAGHRLTAGTLTLRVLSPRSGPTSGATGGDPNQRAIVTQAEAAGARVLLTADAESDVLAGLDLTRIDVLKVAHHGSADPGLPTLLERLQPLVAGIQVGANNTYGHPAPSTLAALRAVPRVVRTDVDGTVRLDTAGDGRWTVTPPTAGIRRPAVRAAR
ncbi:hypothetical protein DSM112329_03246 [Paraconexibacter sp. AEG42_29]|uniref:Metallo-beta-lactamase domain-containing protein n=1 Tax=Paraconexibacter sp. AEG42_29 TaxID=2997339 RepID=A0AAU7AYH6_9ACTN